MKFSVGNLSLKRYIFSFIAAFLITAVFFGIISVLFTFFSPPEWLYRLFISYFCYLSSSLSAFFSALKTQKNGLVTGVLCADIYMFLLIIAGMVIFKNNFPTDSVFKIFGFSSVFGGIAGIIGINFKK